MVWTGMVWTGMDWRLLVKDSISNIGKLNEFFHLLFMRGKVSQIWSKISNLKSYLITRLIVEQPVGGKCFVTLLVNVKKKPVY